MLKRLESSEEERLEFKGNSPQSAGPIDLDFALAAAKRQFRVVLATAMVGLVVGFSYSLTAVPLYTATTDILIDGQKDKNDVSASIAELTFDTAAIDSQVEVLKSEKIAISVVSALKLTRDPEFMGGRGTLIGQALGMVRSAFDFSRWFVTRPKTDPEEQEELQRAAIGRLEGGLDVRRVGRTYVLAVSYTSPSPEKAAVIANAFAEAYLLEQLDSKYDATKRASGWMQARISELKAKSLATDSAVQKFKSDNGLITADGKLVSDQQMMELNTQMVLAHSDTARAEARFNQIEELIKSGQPDGAVTDQLGNPIVTDLRQKFLTRAKLVSDLESKLGSGHLAVVNARHEMEEYRKLITAELQRIAETYRSEGEVARAKEQSLASSMAALVGASAGTNQTMVQLRELERESESYRTLYQTFLQRYQETLQQQSFPVTEARVITAAYRPGAPSYPKRSLILGFCLVVGAAVGAGVGALREYRDRVFRVASQVRNELGLEFFGMLDAVPETVMFKKVDSREDQAGQLMLSNSLQRYSIDHPLSSFSETLRSIKVAADFALRDRKPKVIGIISVLPNEGKSTVSKNTASLLAHLGAKTLLIDGDFRNPGLTRLLAPHAREGVIEAISDERSFNEFLLLEPESGLFFLPAVIRKRLNHSSEVLASPGMRRLLSQAGNAFEYIIVDLPPLGPVIDVRAATSVFDAFVLVIEWGRTARMMVQTLLAADDQIYEKCIGAVFNKVQMSKIGMYENYDSKDYYYERYNKYYRDERENV